MYAAQSSHQIYIYHTSISHIHLSLSLSLTRLQTSKPCDQYELPNNVPEALHHSNAELRYSHPLPYKTLQYQTLSFYHQELPSHQLSLHHHIDENDLLIPSMMYQRRDYLQIIDILLLHHYHFCLCSCCCLYGGDVLLLLLHFVHDPHGQKWVVRSEPSSEVHEWHVLLLGAFGIELYHTLWICHLQKKEHLPDQHYQQHAYDLSNPAN
mmetsp:Transcript_4526/g.6851  ORF Transcript_4526/g.6851 Transcript_4526/m.6851 type:complete len:209 (+) Transcript_4526:180-806(+)